ncbi:hypothetical protein MHZ92_06140 [Sporosarcina sp. ACRSL]|uniref:hypothetical protein n=1 Tax=Sporosarcina sp. ACRSL TaxID=2918215 RepID=UPI001EF6BE86|nr:hypothetical protein [Sporosarcina sp. ACRSL]MCG7343704.1 hypothetical protein [Sporosarcina sp. ACRSL]
MGRIGGKVPSNGGNGSRIGGNILHARKMYGTCHENHFIQSGGDKFLLLDIDRLSIETSILK